MRDLLKKPLVIGSVVGFLVLLIVWWFAWMQPESHKLDGIRQQEQQDQQRVASLRLQLAQLEAEAKVVRASSPFLKYFAAAIPSNPEAPTLVVQLYHLATQMGVKLQSVTDNTVTPAAGYSTIPLEIAVSGPHDSVFNFVRGLYKLNRLVTVQSLGLSGSGDLNASGSGLYSASISATAYTTSAPGAPITGSG